MPAEAASALRIRLFGPFEAQVGDEPLPRLRSRKGEWLLALLVLRHGREVQREWLKGLLWPESPEPQASASLRQSLADLRRALGPEAGLLRSPGPHTLCLCLPPGASDVLEFDRAVRQGDPASLENAVSLYRGPLLEGCAEEWICHERETRHQHYLAAIERLAEHTLGQGEAAEAARKLRLLVAADPLRESGHRLLMQALAASADYAAVTEAYRELRVLLHRELNAAPSPETTTLYEGIRAEGRRKAAASGEPAGNGDDPGRPAPQRLRNAFPSPAETPVPPLSGGTLTFLLTDVEDSSGMLERHGEAMRRALARHNQLIVEGVRREGGVISLLQGEGDSIFAVFPGARDALAAACAMQRALAAEPWSTPEPLRVRMALYTGAAEVIEGRYQGIAIHRCARLRELARGGQILAGESTHDMIRDDVRPEEVGWTLQDLGVYRLRGLSRPERIFQLAHPELPATDALPLGPIGRGRLPQQLTSLVGRGSEVQQVKGRLTGSRLVTLTGTGGIGKTRLSIQVAEEVEGNYLDSAWFVDLSVISTPELVTQSVASALGIREIPGRDLLEGVLEFLRPRSLLLVLDNCEHLLDAAAQLAGTLLGACPNLRILATSREALRLPGEALYRVPSLSIPVEGCWLRAEGPDSAPAATLNSQLSTLNQYDAVGLFVQRAQEARADFVLTPENATAVAHVASRLDGIPLAIELAAARVRALSVEQILARLNDRFRLLTGGSRAALPRQQTLQAALDWSYHLLSEAERALLQRLSVFAGGWTLEASEAVCRIDGVLERWSSGDPDRSRPSLHQSTTPRLQSADILDQLTSLVEKSLVVYEGRDDRYRFLETVRQYARDRLLENGEEAAVRGRHRDFFLGWMEQGPRQPLHGGLTLGYERWDSEYDNLRAALEWSLSDPAGAETALRLAAGLSSFWRARGRATEGRQSLRVALQRGGEVPAPVRGHALYAAAMLATAQDDRAAARPLLEECMAIWRGLGDRRAVAELLVYSGFALWHQGDFEVAERRMQEGLALYRELDDSAGIAHALLNLGHVPRCQGKHAAARAFYEEALAEDALAGRREEGTNRYHVAHVLHNLGHLARSEGDYGEARSRYTESLALFREIGTRPDSALSLEAFAGLATAQDQARRAARLFGAAEACRENIGSPTPPMDRALYGHYVDQARAALGEEAFAAAWAEGRAMTLDEAAGYALEPEAGSRS